MSKMTPHAFVEVINGNIAWVESQPNQCLESRHTVQCLKDTVRNNYNKTYDEIMEEINEYNK